MSPPGRECHCRPPRWSIADAARCRPRRLCACALRRPSWHMPDPTPCLLIASRSQRHGRGGCRGPARDAFGDPFALAVLDGLARELDTLPAALLMLPRTPGDDERLLAQLGAAAVGAIVFALCGPRNDPAVALLASRGIPMIAAGAPVDPRVPQLLIADRAASSELARLLRDLGHRRVGHVTLPLSPDAQTGLARALRCTTPTIPTAPNVPSACSTSSRTPRSSRAPRAMSAMASRPPGCCSIGQPPNGRPRSSRSPTFWPRACCAWPRNSALMSRRSSR